MSMVPYLLAAEGLNKSFSGFQAIRDLNFALEKGELRTVGQAIDEMTQVGNQLLNLLE